MTSPEKIDEDGNIVAAMDRLYRAVCALTTASGQYINNAWAEIPSLYMQLYDAIPGEQGNGHSPARSMPPLWMTAAKTLAEIDTAVRRWQRAVPATFIGPLRYGWCRLRADEAPTVTRLRQLITRSWRPQDTAVVEERAALLEGWAQEIDAFMVREPVRALWAAEGGGFAACPHCEATMAKKHDDAGDYVQIPALQLMKDGSTHCLACKSSWGVEQAMWVCRMLGYPLPEGVLE